MKNEKQLLTKEECLKGLKEERLHPLDVPEEYWEDRTLQKAMLKRSWIFLEKLIASQSWFSYLFEYPYRWDKALLLWAIQQNGLALEHASANLKNEKDVVLAAVKQTGWALQYASANLKKDKEIVLAAVKQDTYNLHYACSDISDDLKGDKEFILKVIKQNVYSFGNASDDLKGDKEFILKAIKLNVDSLCFASYDLRNDRDVVLTAIEQRAGAGLYYASDNLRNDKPIVLEAVKRDGLALEHASANLKYDMEVVVTALRQNPAAQKFIPKKLKKLVWLRFEYEKPGEGKFQDSLLKNPRLCKDIWFSFPRKSKGTEIEGSSYTQLRSIGLFKEKEKMIINPRTLQLELWLFVDWLERKMTDVNSGQEHREALATQLEIKPGECDAFLTGIKKKLTTEEPKSKNVFKITF